MRAQKRKMSGALSALPYLSAQLAVALPPIFPSAARGRALQFESAARGRALQFESAARSAALFERRSAIVCKLLKCNIFEDFLPFVYTHTLELLRESSRVGNNNGKSVI